MFVERREKLLFFAKCFSMPVHWYATMYGKASTELSKSCPTIALLLSLSQSLACTVTKSKTGWLWWMLFNCIDCRMVNGSIYFVNCVYFFYRFSAQMTGQAQFKQRRKNKVKRKQDEKQVAMSKKIEREEPGKKCDEETLNYIYNFILHFFFFCSFGQHRWQSGCVVVVVVVTGINNIVHFSFYVTVKPSRDDFF